MAESFTRTARRFFSPEAIIPFLFGSIALGVLSNAAFTLLTNQLGTEGPSILGIAVGSVAILLLAVWIVSRTLTSRDGTTAIPGKRPPKQHRGLILLVSNLPTCEKAIRFHGSTLERVWLICSTRTLENATQLRRDFSKQIPDEPFIINDVNDPLEFHAAIEKIYEHLPEDWSGRDVIADYVGMTAHGSVGVVLACFRHDRPMQFTPAKYDDNLKPIGPLDPIEITFDSLK